MGIIESTMGCLLQKMLMPKEVPDWYNGRKLTFPQAPPNSLRLLGHVELEASDVGRTHRLLAEALGGAAWSGAPADARVRAGPSELRVVQATGAAVRVWPGHFYLWVADLPATLQRLRKLETEWGEQLVEAVHNVMSSDSIDAVEVEDLDGNRFLLNQAAKGFAERMAKLGAAASADSPNLLALIEVARLVPPGAAAGAARFCHTYFGAAVGQKDRGWALHFAPGRALRQTLLLVDEPGLEDGPGRHALCVYLPSKARFLEAFEKCAAQGLALGPANPAAAEAEQEFRVVQCIDPHDASKKVLFEMEWIVRAPGHPECQVPLPLLD